MFKKLDKKIFFALYNFTASHELISKLAVYFTKFSSKIFSLLYFIIGSWLFFKSDPRLKAFILIPGLVYLLVKLIPILYNRCRPFAEFGLKNLVKQRPDHSFPSTHAASSIIISLVVLQINSQLGILMTLVAVLTAISRIMVGVHYPTDIIGAWLLAGSVYFLNIL